MAISDIDHNPLSPVLSERESPGSPTTALDRTIQELVLSCLATILACTWVATHPNLPGPWDSGWAKMKRKLVTMIYALLSPEFMTIWALRQWIAAGKIAKEFNEKYGSDDAGITCPPTALKYIPNAFEHLWATMKSGLGMYFKGPHRDAPLTWTRAHGFFVQMGGFILYEGRTPKKVLKCDELMKMIEQGEVDIPDYTEDDINDKSKGDFLVILVVFIQTTWFLSQCVARWASHLVVTQLEVVTFALVVFNIITYVLWWNKPHGAHAAIRIQLKHSGAEHESGTPQANESSRGGEAKESWISKRLAMIMNKPWWLWNWAHGWFFGIPFSIFGCLLRPPAKMAGVAKPFRESLRVPMFSADEEPDARVLVLLSLIGVLFGCIHLIPWPYSFPSHTEQWLWRFSVLVVTCEPILTALSALVVARLNTQPRRYWPFPYLWLTAVVAMVLSAPLYLVSRLIILTLAFTSLRDLPEGATSAIEWASFIPHL